MTDRASQIPKRDMPHALVGRPLTEAVRIAHANLATVRAYGTRGCCRVFRHEASDWVLRLKVDDRGTVTRISGER